MPITPGLPCPSCFPPCGRRSSGEIPLPGCLFFAVLEHPVPNHHRLGRAANQAIQESRAELETVLKAPPLPLNSKTGTAAAAKRPRMVFTSGGTESDQVVSRTRRRHPARPTIWSCRAIPGTTSSQAGGDIYTSLRALRLPRNTPRCT